MLAVVAVAADLGPHSTQVSDIASLPAHPVNTQSVKAPILTQTSTSVRSTAPGTSTTSAPSILAPVTTTLPLSRIPKVIRTSGVGGKRVTSPATALTTPPSAAGVLPTTTTAPAPLTTTTTGATSPDTATGTTDSAEPSGEAPLGPDALTGYTQSYVTDFTGTTLPDGWDAYGGQPGSDPGAQWSTAHDVVSDGMLQLETYQDPAYGNEWVAGGLCQCGHSQTYGAYYVRSRVTGAGPTQVELLWPAGPGWPPEVDFNETGGGTTGTSATVHWDVPSDQDQRGDSTVDMTQWHTWGVIWTPTSLTYTLDGKVWGTVNVASEVPNEAMTLDLQQQTWCGTGGTCPTAPVSMDIDWVAEYSPS
jgi:Glycosyl hydrolases family 16